MDKLGDIKRTWRDRFNDSRVWMTEVFSRIYRDEDAMIVDEGNRVVSSLLLRPYKMNFRGKDMPMGYIYGAATAREYQGKGYMSRLMADTLRASRNRGEMVVSLIPARPRLYDFYCRFGFSTVFFYQQLRYTAAHKFAVDPSLTVDDSVCDPAELSSAYNRLCALTRSAFVTHSDEDFKDILIDNELDRGLVAVARDAENGSIRAIAFGNASTGQLVVSELVADSDLSAQAALHSLKERAGDMLTLVEHAPSESKVKLLRRGMARIVDAEAVLRLLASIDPKISMTIHLADPIVEENNAVFKISKGKVERAVDAPEPYDLDVSIEVLTSILFSTEKVGDVFGLPSARPFMSLMLS